MGESFEYRPVHSPDRQPRERVKHPAEAVHGRQQRRVSEDHIGRRRPAHGPVGQAPVSPSTDSARLINSLLED